MDEQPEFQTNITTLDKLVFGTSTIFKNVCVYEQVDPQLLFNIIHTAELISFDKKRYADGMGKFYKTERDLLVAYQYQWVESVNRFVSQWKLPKHGWGRILPRDYLSMSVFHRPTRHTLCHQHLVDLDLVNCHFEIVLSYMQNLNMECEHIEKYCLNVSHYRTEIMKFYNVSKDTAKALFIRLIYGGSLVGWKLENGISTFDDPDILVDISQQLHEFMEVVWNNNQHIYKDLVNNTPNYYKTCTKNQNMKTLMAFWCQSIERYIQEQVILHLVNTYKFRINNFIPCQDGFMMRKADFKPEHIESINIFIKDSLKFVSKFIQKPFNEIYKVLLPSSIHNYKPFCLKHLEDAQFATLLIDVGFKYNQIITTGDSKYLEGYMYNSVYWEKLPLHNAEFQKGRFDYLENWCNDKLFLLTNVLHDASNNTLITIEEIENLKTTKRKLKNKLAELKTLKPIPQEEITQTETKLNAVETLIENQCIINKSREKIRTLSRYSVRKNIIELFLGKLHISNIEWDKNPDLFAFNNGVFDLSLHKFIPPTKDQYIKNSCGWAWNHEYNENNIDIVNELITSILPIKAVRDYYLTYTSLGLSGNKVQRLLINTGCGGNGKSLLRELFNVTAGKYSMKIPTEVVCSAIKASSANPVIASMNGMRNIYFSEPDSNQKLCVATIKEITGDGKIVGRQLYSSDTVVNLIATISSDTNKVPPLDDNDPTNKASIERRLVVVPYITTAVTQEMYDASIDKTHLNVKKNYAENPNWLNDNKQAYFMILVNYYMLFKTIPNILDQIPIECQNRTDTYLNSSCDIISWVNNNFVRIEVDKSDPIKLKDIYIKFKDVDTFKTFTKKEQRTYCQKYFIDLLITSKELKPFIVLTDKYHNGIKLKSPHLIGYKYINDGDVDELDTV